MNTPNLRRQPYRRPPLVRATDPQRMNWLWRLVCEVADIRSVEVVEALHALQIPVDQQRARSWTVSDSDDSFFPMSIAEVERNLRALIVLRTARREEGDGATAADLAEVAADEDGELDFDADADAFDEIVPQTEPAEEDGRAPDDAHRVEGEA